MKIISVAGATSKAGKTLLCEQLIRYCSERYRPVYGIKFTTTSDVPSPCPRGAPCTVCDLSDRFRIIRDASILNQPGKNTARLLAAGATEVIWVVTRRSELPVAYEHLLTHIPAHALVVMEGSTVTSLCNPDLLLYIFSGHISRSRWKDSAQEIIRKADCVILNRKAGRPDDPQLAPPQSMVIDLARASVTNFPAIKDKIDLILKSIA